MLKTTGHDRNGQGRVKAPEAAGIESAEAKRLAARRRFLLGGAAAVPVIVTLGQKQAWAASAAVCQSMNLTFRDGFSDRDKYLEAKGQLAASVYCRPY